LKHSFKAALSKVQKLVSKKMDELLKHKNFNTSLADAMRYSALSDGKKIRPFLLFEAVKILDGKPKDALIPAIALEFLHTYSLIHDDLPSMDNDDYRRGKLSCHKKYGEATAILAGDALLTYSFEVLSDKKANKSAEVRCELVNILANYSGFNGMILGQFFDLQNDKITKNDLLKLHSLKTGKLFLAPIEMALKIAPSQKNQALAMKNFAKTFGLIFQIKDDISDYYKDNKNNIYNKNILDFITIDEAEKKLDLLKSKAKNYLNIFGKKADTLKDLVNSIDFLQNPNF
jgi:geranylgeranyl pyrophosphate synthase